VTCVVAIVTAAKCDFQRRFCAPQETAARAVWGVLVCFVEGDRTAMENKNKLKLGRRTIKNLSVRTGVQTGVGTFDCAAPLATFDCPVETCFCAPPGPRTLACGGGSLLGGG
jgi:hypothetical protein